MKKLVYGAALLILAGCSANEKKEAKSETETKTEVAAVKKYACPMQCEGTKTYAEAGKCPVCKMDLQEIAMAETDSTAHSH